MIAVISEYRYPQPEIKKLQEQKAVVNYTLLPNFYQSYATEIARINYTLIKKSTGVIFRLQDYYAGTKDAIEYALYLKRPVKIITPEGETYKLDTKEEWKYSYKDTNNRNVTTKHQVLLAFEEKRSSYYEAINLSKAKESYERAVDGIQESQEEIERFVRALAPQYKVEVNYADWAELCQAYKSIKFYYDNNIPYDLTTIEIYKSVITPDESEYFTEEMFYTTPINYDSYEEESFGNETLLEDTIYKTKEKEY